MADGFTGLSSFDLELIESAAVVREHVLWRGLSSRACPLAGLHAQHENIAAEGNRHDYLWEGLAED